MSNAAWGLVIRRNILLLFTLVHWLFFKPINTKANYGFSIGPGVPKVFKVGIKKILATVKKAKIMF